MSYNKFNPNGLYDILRMMRFNSSIKVLHLTQKEKQSDKKLLSLLCEIILTNKSLRKLHFDVEIPKELKDGFASFLKNNTELVSWNHLEMNKIIQGSIETKKDIKQVLLKEMQGIIAEKQSPDSTELSRPLREEMEEVYRAKGRRNWASKRLEKELSCGRVEFAQLAKVLVDAFAHIESKLCDEDVLRTGYKEMESKVKMLEERVGKLEKNNKRFRELIHANMEVQLKELQKEISKQPPNPLNDNTKAVQRY